jgi:hypothetical protein
MFFLRKADKAAPGFGVAEINRFSEKLLLQSLKLQSA